MKHTIEIDTIDKQTLYGMSLDDYKRYIEEEVFYIDHHDFLRSAIAGYPLAATRQQLHALISYLQGLEFRVGADRSK